MLGQTNMNKLHILPLSTPPSRIEMPLLPEIRRRNTRPHRSKVFPNRCCHCSHINSIGNPTSDRPKKEVRWKEVIAEIQDPKLSVPQNMRPNVTNFRTRSFHNHTSILRNDIKNGNPKCPRNETITPRFPTEATSSWTRDRPSTSRVLFTENKKMH